jgi:hypothetical protein
LGSTQNAFAARIGDVISEVGVNWQNAGEVVAHFGNLLGMVENGTLDWAEAAEQVDKAFGPIVEHLETLGIEGAFQIGALVTRMRELGAVTGEVQAFIEEKAKSAIENFAKFFEYIAEQEQLTAEEAKNVLTQMTGAFQAAVAATGSLVGAIEMLGPTFGQLLEKMRGVLGEENAMLNAMQRYYNFVSNNQEQLSAIAALGAAFKDLAASGDINKKNINEFAAAFKDQFADILSKTEDENTALAAMGPQIGQLLKAFQSLGVDVPPWLVDLAAKAKEAGASLAPPEGLPDILKDIRDILLEIGDALGAASREAGEFGRNLGNLPSPDLPGGGGGRPDLTAKTGLDIPRLNKDALIQAHRGESVQIGKPEKMASQTSVHHIHLEMNGREMQEFIIETVDGATSVRRARIHPGSVM